MVEIIALDDPETEVVLRRSRRARRMTLTVPGRGEPPRVTAPPHASLSEIRMFLMRQSDWLRRALVRAPQANAVAFGATIPVAGARLLIAPSASGRRLPLIEGERLLLPEGAAPGPRIAVWLKERARASIAPIAHNAAAELGARAGRITMKDTKGRWGSCSVAGNLNFSWRLAMAPPEVLDYVAVHEAAHLREMNHGSRFWALVESLRPDWRLRRDWLKKHGGELQSYRFDI